MSGVKQSYPVLMLNNKFTMNMYGAGIVFSGLHSHLDLFNLGGQDCVSGHNYETE